MLPKPSLNPAPIRQLTAPLRLPGLAGLAALTLASCAGQYQYAQQTGQTRVHPRVAQARPIQGIDVSKYQGKIDWASVRSAGTHFAFIKATEGGTHVDERFVENWDGAKQAGVARGARLPLHVLVPAGRRTGRMVQAHRPERPGRAAPGA